MTNIDKELDLTAIVKAAIERHGATREALISILSEVNSAYGFLPPQTYAEIRRQLTQEMGDVIISEGQIFSLASFYHMLSTDPLGRHVVRFCESAPCHVVGGREVFQAVKDALHLKPGQTTPDQKWSLITTSCLGVCAVGPVMLVDEDIYGNITPEQVPGILARYE